MNIFRFHLFKTVTWGSFLAQRCLLLQWLTGAVLIVGLSACDRLPNPVERKDGYSWIPIADTAFLIQDKAWLKGYGRLATDGAVHSFHLHAMAPTMEPWSPENNRAMYLPGGFRGAVVDIYIRIAHYPDLTPYPNFVARFRRVPQSEWGGHALVEESSEFSKVGLRKFREALHVFKEGPNKGQTLTSKTVFYEHIESDNVKYFIRCGDDGGALNHCYLSFPYSNHLEVELAYWRTYLEDSVVMADKITERLKEFEAVGRARLAEKLSNPAH